MRRRPLVVVLALALIGGWTRPVSADPPRPEIGAVVQRAQLAFQRRAFDEAFAIYQQVYDLVGDPGAHFWMARCHEESGRIEAAIECYDRFLADPKAKKRPARVQEAKTRRKQLRAVLKAQGTAVGASRIDAAPRELEAHRSGQRGPEPTKLGVVIVIPPPPHRDPYRTAGWSTLGAGMAVVVAGAIAHGIAAWKYQDVIDAANSEEARQIDVVPVQEEIEDLRIGAYTAYGVAGSLIVTGLVLLLLPDAPEDQSLSWDGSSLSYRLAF